MKKEEERLSLFRSKWRHGGSISVGRYAMRVGDVGTTPLRAWPPATRQMLCLMDRFALRPSPSSVVRFVSPAHRGQKVIQDKVCYVAAKSLTGDQVKAEMLSTEDTA